MAGDVDIIHPHVLSDNRGRAAVNRRRDSHRQVLVAVLILACHPVILLAAIFVPAEAWRTPILGRP